MALNGWDALTSDEEAAVVANPSALSGPPLGSPRGEALVPTHPRVDGACEHEHGIIAIDALRAVVPRRGHSLANVFVARDTNCEALLLPGVGSEMTRATVLAILNSKDRTSSYESTLKQFAMKKTTLTFPGRQAMSQILGLASHTSWGENRNHCRVSAFCRACISRGRLEPFRGRLQT